MMIITRYLITIITTTPTTKYNNTIMIKVKLLPTYVLMLREVFTTIIILPSNVLIRWRDSRTLKGN